MRTTFDIEDDVLQIAKELAAQQQKTTGQMISFLVRQALEPKSAARTRNGVPLFQPKLGAAKPSMELVNQLRDAE